MQVRGTCLVWSVLVVSMALSGTQGAESTPVAPPTVQTLTVSAAYNQQPFDYQMQLRSQRDGFCIYRLSFASPVVTALKQNNTVRADFYLPDNIKPGSAKRPAVVMLHVLNGDMRLTDAACTVLARRGIPAVMPTLPYYAERAKPEGWEALLRDPKLFAEMFDQAIEDTRRTADLLASRPEVEPTCLGVGGMSMGGIIAASVAGTERRFSRASLFLAGGDVITIVNHARYTRDLSARLRQLPPDERAAIVAMVESRDPVTVAPGLRARGQQGRVLMINAANDEIIPRVCTEKLARALGMGDRVVWVDDLEHDTFISALPQSLRTISEFFAQDLPSDVPPRSASAVAEPTPLGRAANLLHELAKVFDTGPAPDRCHVVDMEITVRAKGQPPSENRVRFIRGNGDRFALKLRMPWIGDVMAGKGRFPWFVVGGTAVLNGVKNPVEKRHLLCQADPRTVAGLRLFAGLLGTLDLIPPESLRDWLDIGGAEATDGGYAVRIALKDRISGNVLVHLREDGRTPSEVSIDVAGVSGNAVIREWQLDAVANDAMFNPPAGLTTTEVDQTDVYRAFGTALNLVIRSISM